MANQKSYKQKITMKFNISKLDRILIACLNSVKNKKFIANVNRLFNSFIEESYLNDYEKEIRVFLIKKITNIILEQNVKEKDSILVWLDTDGKFSADADGILNGLFETELSDEELNLLDKSISDQLRYGYLESEANSIIDSLNNLKTENYNDFNEIIGNLTNKFDIITRDLRAASESIDDSKKEVSLSNGLFVNALGKLIDEEKNPDTKIKTGIRAFNEMIGGGFEKGRLYVALAVAKNWKSGFMLKMARDAKKYNNLKTKDPDKRPVVLYLTMENSISETINRLWAGCFGNDCKISDYTPGQAADMFERAKVFTPNDPNSPELILMYRSCKSINTGDLRGILNDMEKQNKECCFLILDYLKRIKSVNPNKEIRLELGQITDELSSIAKDYEIPVLTANQLNRKQLCGLIKKFISENSSLSWEVLI